MFKSLVLLGLFMVGAVAASTGTAQAKDLPLLRGIKRILFLGDSITYAGGYVDYIQAYLESHDTENVYDIIDMGLPSETVSGLTEPGHAGGAFPRPVLSERIDRVLAAAKPDLVFACYGMNDGIYYPYAEERFAKYRDGIQALVDKVTAAKARIVLVTPPPFDAKAATTLPAGLKEYRQPFEGYDQALEKYSAWLVKQRSRGWQVVDIHTPINQYLAAHRKFNPEFKLSGDGVHLNAMGHWLIANQILDYLGATTPTALVIDARFGRPVRGAGTTVEAHPDYISIGISAWAPMPLDPQLTLTEEERDAARKRFDELTIRLRGEKAAVCRVTCAGTDVGEFTREQLQQGISLGKVIVDLGKERSDKLLGAVHTMRSTLTDSYLTAAGHKRPGMPAGMLLDQALERAQAIQNDITPLMHPVPITIEVRQVRL